MKKNSNRISAARFMLGLCMGLSSAAAFAHTLKIVAPEKTVELSFEELQQKLHAQTITVQDPVYRKAKQYDGFALRDVLALAGVAAGDEPGVIFFKTLDGYTPRMQTAKVTPEAFVAFQDHGSTGTFEGLVKGETVTDPGPYYLVWTSDDANDRPWPYQLVELEILSYPAARYALTEPAANASRDVLRGYKLFDSKCVTCHTINGQGGNAAPDLNVPKNITEYFDGDMLRRFIQDPASVRYGSRMTRVDNLTEDDIGNLIAYLSHMKSRKVNPK